jgi:uncharacterized protein (TIGR04540 family)
MSSLFDNYNYVAYPEGIVEFAENLKMVVDDYRSRKLTNQEFTKIITYYANANPEKLYNMQDYNITVKRKLGKTRMEIISKLLRDYQEEK